MHWPHGPAFSALDWDVPAGAALVQGGPGSGKTTLLRVLAAALAPTHGQVRLRGGPVVPEDVFWHERDAAGADQMVVRDWWRSLSQRHPDWSEAELERHVEGFALAAHQDKAFFMLSTGTRRKAWFAAALASGAPVTLIDEPLAGLDLASARYLAAAIAETAAVQTAAVDTPTGETARKPGRVIVVAHDAPLAGVPWATQLALPDAR